MRLAFQNKFPLILLTNLHKEIYLYFFYLFIAFKFFFNKNAIVDNLQCVKLLNKR